MSGKPNAASNKKAKTMSKKGGKGGKSSEEKAPSGSGPSASDQIVAELLKHLKKTEGPKQPVYVPPPRLPTPPVEEEEAPPPFEVAPAGVVERNAVKQGHKKWSDVPEVGKVIENTRFICFKTPLDMALPTNPDYNTFTSDQLIQDHMPSRGRTLGMVVDLTDTYKFYDPYDAFESKQVKHVKLFCPGVDAIPSPEKVLQFNDMVLKFIKDTEGSPDKNGEDVLVGIHCNTGVNMTAYFVLQFMITKMFRNQTRAIVAFETARGVPITSEQVKNDLKAMKPFKVKEFLDTKPKK